MAKKTRSPARPRAVRFSKPARSGALRRAVFATLRAPRFAGGSLLSGLLFAGTAFANPQEGTVTAGAASIVAATPERLNVVQTTDSAIINWRGFSIDQGEHTDFQQPSSSSVTLNRVTGNQASLIAGNLTANGIVMLVNPNGVVFGETGTVDVGGLVATTANIKDEDFLSRRMNFDQASPHTDAGVRNAGSITIRNQGLAALVAPSVQNSGVIQARLGKVALGGAQTFSLDFQGDGLLSFAAGSAIQGAIASNTGRILADGGTVQLAASAVKSVVDQVINTSGVIEARSVSNQNGRIILSGGDSGTIHVAGSLDVSSEDGKGGDVHVSGDRIAVASGTNIDASGNTGGGRIDIGLDANGEWSGAVRVAHGALLNADAGDSGNGGVVNVLSNRSTVFAGHISARGGAQSGGGGTVEVSGRDNLSISGSVDLNASNGRTGDLLLDPATLTITDTGVGTGDQDQAANDGTIGFEDQDIDNNTISRGTLEALSGGANITLEATGQITIEAMAGDLIDLQTDSDHSFTLRSTLIGGIRFVDATTEIRTQGGDIILQALRSGELLNIGRLTTNGGNITLTASGVVQLANVLNAAAGTVTVTSLANSIRNLGSATITGSAITLDASYGNLGEADFALTTNTTDLSLATGGNLFVNNQSSLSRLAITSLHAKDEEFTFLLSAPLLVFDVVDDEGEYDLRNISNAGDLRFTFSGDNDLEVGTINAAGGDVALTSTEGSIFDDDDEQTLITGDDLTLAADGFIGLIGGEGGPNTLGTAVATATLIAGEGGVSLRNTGALNLLSLQADESSGIAASGNLTVGLVTVHGELSLLSGGDVASTGGPNGTIEAEALRMDAAGAVGTIGTPISTSAEEVSAVAANGIYISTTDSVQLDNVVSLNGPITVRAEGEIEVDYVDGGAGTVTLIAGEGGIHGRGFDDDYEPDDDKDNSIVFASGEGGDDDEEHIGPHVVAGTFIFDASSEGGGVELDTAVGSVTGIAGEDGIDLQQTGAITITSLTSVDGDVEVTAQQGDVTVVSVTGETVFISADDGSVLDDGQVNTRITAEDDLGLRAYFGLGTTTGHLQTSTRDLSLQNGGNFFVDNDLALEQLSIENFHDGPGAHTLELTSPYLRFDVIDTGTQFEINDITGVTLFDLTFEGDQTIVFGNVNTPNAEVDLIAGQGNLLNDADIDTQIKADTLRLTTNDGDIGEIGGNGALQVNTDDLSIRATGDVLVTDLTDLDTLSILHRHDEDVPEDYQFAITAPSLRFDVVDSSSGYALNHITDITGLSLSFYGDRTITAGTIDVTRNGRVDLISSDGSILDDGIETTYILAEAVDLESFEDDIGSSGGAGALDVVTETLFANAGEGGIYIHLPYPTNEVSLNGDPNVTNTNRAVTLSEVEADDSIHITLDNGDLRVSDVSSNDTVTLIAGNGSILVPGASGGFGLFAGPSARIFADDLTLSASHSVGEATDRLGISVPGDVTASAGGGGIHLENETNFNLLTATAVDGPIDARANRITVGAISAGTGPITLFAAEGMIDDGNVGTRITGSSVTLDADFGNIGAADNMIGVATPGLSLSGRESFYVDDSVALSALAIETTSGGGHTYAINAAGLTFNVTDDGSTTTLAEIGNDTALTFEFSTQNSLRLGAVDTNAGTAILTSSGNILDDGEVGTTIASTRLALIAGGSIGATGVGGNALAIATEELVLKGAADFYVDDSLALTSLAIETTGFGQNSFGLTALGATLTISDNGSTQYLEAVSGQGLADFSFVGNKNLRFGEITASDEVRLVTGNGTMIMDSGKFITADAVTLDTLNGSGSHIGTTLQHIATETSALDIKSSGNVFVTNAQSLDALAIRHRHSVFTNYSVVVAATNISEFSITDGSTVVLSDIAATSMDFSYATDRVIQANTINVGTGDVGLTSSVDSSGVVIRDDDSQVTRITANAVSLRAEEGTSGHIGAANDGDIDVTTANLSIRSTGNIYVNDNAQLDSLEVTALHSELGNRTYSISASGLAFTVADQGLVNIGGLGTVITSVGNDGEDLDFSWETDRTLQVVNINAGNGSVVLDTDYSDNPSNGGTIYDDGNSGTKIVADSLTLRGRSAGNGQGSAGTQLDTDVSFLEAQLLESLYLVNDGTLTLHDSSINKRAEITVTEGSILSDGDGRLASDILVLSTVAGSIGANGNALQVDALSLTLSVGYDLFMANGADLMMLNIDDSHAAERTNALSLTGRNLAFNVVDNGGGQFNLIDVGDVTGVDFAFRGDQTIQLGSVDVRGGNSLAIRTVGEGPSIIDDGGNGATELSGAQITLSAVGSVGLTNVIEVNTENLTLVSGYGLNVSSNVDLSALEVELNQPGGSPAPTFVVAAPSLTFDVIDDGTITTINDITDATGINLTFNSDYSLQARTINAQRHGYVTLISVEGDLVGGNSGVERITAAQGTFQTLNGGAIGTLANPLQLSTPQLELRATGDIYIASDTHIDTMDVEHRHGEMGTYAITSPSLTYTVSDSVEGLTITEITDTQGLDLSYANDQDVTLGTINLGIAGDLNLGGLDNGTVNFLGDGDTDTVITASGVQISSVNGNIGTSVNPLQISAQSFSGFADDGGLNAHFTGPVRIDSIIVNGDSQLSADGDIYIEDFEADDNKVQVATTNGSIFGSITDTGEVTLNAVGGSIGTASDPFSTSADNEGITTLTATATGGGIYFEEQYDLVIASATAAGAIEIETEDGGIVLGTITATNAPVTLVAGEGGIFGDSQEPNLITGTAVSLTAGDSGDTYSIGSSETSIGVNTAALTLDARGDMFVANQADLDSLTIRRNADNNSFGGDFDITATNLTFTAADNGTTTTLTEVSDTTGLHFSFSANDALAVGIINVGASSDVTLESERANGDGAINATGQNQLITARNLTLNVEGFESNIGSLQSPINTAIASLDAEAGIGGIYIEQTGPLLLNEVDSDGALSVETTSGNLIIGSISYGDGQPLTLTAAASLLDDGVNSTVIEGNGSGTITLGAVDGIGTADAPIVIEDDDFNIINATVSGAGSAYLTLESFATPTVNVTATNGSINLDTTGYFTLGDIISTTDAAGNNISVLARNGDLTLGNLTAGAQNGTILVNNTSGALYGRTPNAISAFDVTLLASGNIGGGLNNRLNVTGQSIAADTRFGSVFLGPTGIAVLGFVRALNGEVDVLGTSEILAANVLANSGITLATSGNSRIVAGNINAGNSAVNLSAANGVIVDDGVDSTRVIGGVGTFTSAGGVGNSVTALQTELAQVSATATFNGGQIYINEASDLQINNLQTAGGAINVVTAGAMTGAGNVNAGGQSITLFAGEGGINLTGDITTTGTAQNATVDLTAQTIGVANVSSTGEQQFHGDTTVSGNLTGGSVRIEGTLDLAGVGTREFEATANGGQIVVQGAVDGNGAGLILDALESGDIVFFADAGNLASLSANSTTMSFYDVLTSGAQNYKGDVTFYGDTYTTQGGSFTAGTALFATDAVITTNGGEVSFTDTVNSGTGQVGFSAFIPFDGGPPTPQDLTIDAGVADVLFASHIGDQSPLGALIVNSSGLTEFGGNITAGSVTTDAAGTARLVGAQATTTGAQTYGESLTVSTDTTFTGTIVTFGGALEGRFAGDEDVFVVGNAVFNGGAGTTTQLALIDVTGTASVRGTLNTSGTQTYDGAITLTGDTTFQVGDDLTFNSTIDGAFGATVNASTGSDVTFNAAVGGTTRIGALAVNSDGVTNFNSNVTAASVATDSPGSVVFNTGLINTTGTQTYADAGTLSVDTTLTGTLVSLTGGLNDSTAGQHALIINGNAVLSGGIGGVNQLKSLTVSGTTTVGGGVSTENAQDYTGAMTLSANTTLTGSGLTFGSTIDGPYDLSLIAGDNSSILLGAVGGTTRLGSLSITTAGETRFNGAVRAASVSTDAPGTVVFNSSSIDTTGTQSYSDAATLHVNTVLAGTTISLLGTVDDLAAGLHSLTITGNGVFGAVVGGVNALGSLGVSGATAINTAKIITTGAQTYTGAVTLGADTELTTSLATFSSTVNGTTAGAEILNVKGNAVFNAGYGNVTALESVMIQGTAGLTGALNTAGTQRFHNTITLLGDTTVTTTNGDALFLTTVDGAHALTVNAGGGKSVTFNEEIGNTTRIGDLAINTSGTASFNGSVRAASISTDGPGTMEFNGGLVDTTGAQSYADAAVMTVDTTLVGSLVTLGGTVNGANALGITGPAVFGAAVGGTTALSSLNVTGASTINGGAITTTGAQTYTGPITLGASTTLTGSLITAASAINPTVIIHSLSIDGDATLSANLGDQAPLWFFDVTGATSLGGSVTTIGDQTFHGAVTLTDDISLLAGEGGGISFLSALDGAYSLSATATNGVLFDGAVGGTTRLNDISVFTTGLTRFNAPVRAGSLLTDGPGTLILNAGTVDTTGVQNYGEAVTLYADTTLTGTSVIFGGTVDDSGIGLHSLTITGDAWFTQAVGNNIALSALSVSGGSLIDGGLIKTTGAQNYTGAVTVSTDTELTASLATFSGTVNGTTAGEEVFNVKGGAVFNAGFGTTTALESVMIQGTAGLTGALNTAGTQRFHNTITLLGDTTSTTVNGDALFLTTVDGPYALTVNAGGNKSVIFNEEVGNTTRIGNLIVNTGGATSFNGSVYAAAVTTDGPGTVELNGGLVDTTGAQSYGEVALLGVSTTLKGTSVTFADTVDSGSGHLALSIEGDAVFDAAIGGENSLASLAVTGTTALNGGSVETEGGQTYGGAVTLSTDTIFTASADMAFNSTVDGAHDVTVNSLVGDVAFNGAVGGTSRLQDLVVNSAGATAFASVNAASIVTDAPGIVIFTGGTIDTTGTQTFGDATVVAGDTTLVAPTVQLLGVVNDATAGQHALAITGNALFDKSLGNTSALGALNVSGTSLINGGVMKTAGAQTYGGAVTLGASTAMTGSLITANSTINGTTAGAQSLSVIGNAVFNAGFGTQTALASTAVSGTAGVTGSLNTVGGQSYGGAMSLLGDTTLMAGEGGTTFSSTIDGAQALTVNVGNNGVTFNGAVGGGVRLGNLLVNSGGATTFNNSVRATSVTTNSAGSVALNGSGVDTTGTQSYGEVVTLGADATLTGSTVTFAAAINDASAGQHALTIAGNGVFGSTVGATTALRALNVSGTSAVNGGSVRTTGAQTYGGALTLGGNTTLTGSLVTTNAINGTTAGQQELDIVGDVVFNGGFGSQVSLASVDVSGTAGMAGTFNTLGAQTYQGAITLLGATAIAAGQNPINFLSTIDGTQSLTVNAGSNAVSFNGAIGGTTRLGSIVVNSGGATEFNAAVRAANVTTDVAGSVALNGGSVDTTGAQSYGENVTLGANTTLTATNVTFTGTVNAATAGLQTLSIVGDGIFNAAVGNVAALKSLAVSGTSLLHGGSVVTTAGQNYGGAMTFDANTTLTSGGNVVFGSGIDTPNVSSLNIAAPAGSISIAGAVGGGGPVDQFVLLSGLNGTFGAITAKNIDLTVGTGATQFNAALTASTGAISIKNPNGTLSFAATAPINAATGFTQTGGAVQLASSVGVAHGPITFSGPLTLVGDTIFMETDGDITLAGVSGLGTVLDVTAGTGVLKGGKRDGTVAEQIQLLDMIVNTAASAELFGSLNGIGGGGTAKFVKSMLVGPPYFFNDVPFGPLEFVDRLIVQTADQNTNVTHYTVESAEAEATGEFPEQSIVQGLRAEPAPDLLGVKDEKNSCTVESGCEVRTISIE